jgi:thiol-disulfide isomerase/thioredoxin
LIGTGRTRTGICRFLFAVLLLGAAASPAAFAANSLVNSQAPEFARMDLNGKRLDLRGFRGKVVLLNFWATWCAPCQVEMPVFAAWQRQYGPQGLQVVGISMDDSPAPVRGLVARLKLNYPVAMGDAALGERYGGVLGLPLTYLIDRDGKVRARFQGETDLKTIEKQLKLLLSHP